MKQPDFPVVLVLLDGRPAPGLPFLRQLHWIVTADPASAETVGRLRDATSGGGARPGELWRYTAPYRGLASMTEADSDFFFGREQQTVDVVNAIAATRERLAILIGNSGVGKSSLAQAGVLGALKRQAWPDGAGEKTPWPPAFHDSRHWCFLKMQPGARPIKALVEPFLKTWQIEATDPKWEERRSEWIAALTAGKASLSGLLDATERRYEELGQPRPPAFFLYVDQGEELYVRAEESERPAFSRLLAEAIADPRLYAMMSLRSDFFGALQNDQQLFSVHGQINVPPLREAELRQVVSQPAALLSARFESDQLCVDLARRAAEESAHDAGALPLLSYLLDDMWTDMVARGDGMLRLPPEAMELGGVLAERADAFLARHPDTEPELRRLLTLKLATVREDGEPTRRRAQRSEFSDVEWRMVSELADHPHRLLVTATPEGGETYAEVAHEAIFKRWGKLRQWIAAEREFLSWRSRLEGARRSWEGAPTHACNDALLMGLALAEAQQWLARRAEDLPHGDRVFIEKSVDREIRERQERDRERAQREQMRRRMLQGAVVALILVTALAGFSVFQMFEANRQSMAAETERVAADQQRIVADERRRDAELARIAAEAATLEAEAQKARAQRSFAAAKVAIDKLIFEVAGDLGKIAGMRVDTIRTILDTVSKTIDQLAQSAPDDTELLRSRSAMFNMFVDTYMAAGDVNGALHAAEESLKIARKLSAAAPDDGSAERDVSISLERLGDVEFLSGDTKGALAAYQDRLAFARRLLAKDPSDPQAQRDLSVSLNKVGDVRLRTGDRTARLPPSTRAWLSPATSSVRSPRIREAKRDVGISLTKVGDVKMQSSDFDAATRNFQDALDTRKQLSDADPGNAQMLRDVSVSLNRLGDVKLKVKDVTRRAGRLPGRPRYRPPAGPDGFRQCPGPARSVDQPQQDRRRAARRRRPRRRPPDLPARPRHRPPPRRGRSRQRPGPDRSRRLADPRRHVSDEPGPFYRESLDILTRLDGEGRLSNEQDGWIDWVRGQVDTLKASPPPPTATPAEAEKS